MPDEEEFSPSPERCKKICDMVQSALNRVIEDAGGWSIVIDDVHESCAEEGDLDLTAKEWEWAYSHCSTDIVIV